MNLIPSPPLAPRIKIRLRLEAVEVGPKSERKAGVRERVHFVAKHLQMLRATGMRSRVNDGDEEEEHEKAIVQAQHRQPA